MPTSDPEKLIQVRAPHFTAAIVIKFGRCVQASPILGWTVTRDENYLREYFKRKGWQAVQVTALP